MNITMMSDGTAKNTDLKIKISDTRLKYNDMPCCNVGKKPDHQCKWLGKQADNLHRDHDGCKQFRYTRCINDMTPVAFYYR